MVSIVDFIIKKKSIIPSCKIVYFITRSCNPQHLNSVQFNSLYLESVDSWRQGMKIQEKQQTKAKIRNKISSWSLYEYKTGLENLRRFLSDFLVVNITNKSQIRFLVTSRKINTDSWLLFLIYYIQFLDPFAVVMSYQCVSLLQF